MYVRVYMCVRECACVYEQQWEKSMSIKIVWDRAVSE